MRGIGRHLGQRGALGPAQSAVELTATASKLGLASFLDSRCGMLIGEIAGPALRTHVPETLDVGRQRAAGLAQAGPRADTTPDQGKRSAGSVPAECDRSDSLFARYPK